MGSFLSILLFIIVVAFTYQKVDVWLGRKDVDIMSANQKNFYTEDHIFDHSQGLHFALAFTAYDNNPEDILDPTYGNIEFTTYEWGTDEQGDVFVKL